MAAFSMFTQEDLITVIALWAETFSFFYNFHISEQLGRWRQIIILIERKLPDQGGEHCNCGRTPHPLNGNTSLD